MAQDINTFVSDITVKNWSKMPLTYISKNSRKNLKFLKNKYKDCSIKNSKNKIEKCLYNSFYIIERVCKLLIKQNSYRYISSVNDEPVLGKLAYEFSESLCLDIIIKGIKAIQEYKYISNTDISTLDIQLKFHAINMITKAIRENNITEFDKAVSCLFIWENIDYEELNKAINPIEQIYNQDYYYPKMSKETRGMYREYTSLIAQHTQIDEKKLANQYINRCKKAKTPKDSHVGKYIFDDFKNVFPKIKPKSYVNSICIISFVLSIIISALAQSFWYWLLLYLPIFAASKIIFDEALMRKVITHAFSTLPRMEHNGEISPSLKTIAVVSTLLTGDKEILHLEKMIEQLSYTNPAKNLYYCILCDLKASDSKTHFSDSEIIKKAQSLSNKINEIVKDKCIVIIRNRSFCKTQNNYCGWERKRGAIQQLIEEISGNSQDFLAFFGKREILKDIKYICALDYDTNALMDSIADLVSIAAHPLNQAIIENKKVVSGYGIICPRITTNLTTSLKTPFAKLMGGVGGTCTYDDFSADLYQSTFKEGIFTGKGLIDVKAFNECCKNRFEEERVLSHDILEGIYLKTAYAGDVEFSDNFPLNTTGYFKRLERWIRGDVQNLPYTNKKNNISFINRFKLWDNIRRCITPIIQFAAILVGAFVKNGWILGLTSLVSVIIPFITSFVPNVLKWGAFGFSRKFYSGIKPQATQLIIQSILNLLLLPKIALISLKSLTLGIWRRYISKKNLLQWTTAAQTDTISTPIATIKEFIIAEILSFILILSFKPFFIVLGIFFLSALPVMIYCNNPYSGLTKTVPSEIFDQLKAEANKMWSFYKAFVTTSENFLPPDNVQYAPVFAIAHRTSPTNMGMYAVSVLNARDLGLIDTAEMYFKLSNLINTIETLDKWKGNLFNWYDTRTKSTLNRIVSSVDSGNFLCSMVVLKEGIWEYEKEDSRIRNLICRIETLINQADLSAFYDKSKGLLSIAYDEEAGQFSNNHYDLLMSEARMTSYYAIAMGQVPKNHWKKLGHTMSRLGNYAGPISWTGTMFEYFMPELFLKCPQGSLGYEALKYAIYCQKYRANQLKIPFGFSESGFYAFDSQLNYQYKAHGTQYLGLKRDLHKEMVVSPYSSFLILSYDLISGVNNLVRLEKLGASHRDYGFYEAVDFTPQRANDKGYCIVKSHMSHHIGMSMISIANAILDGINQRRFMSDNRMKRASELLEQKVILGEIMLEDFYGKQPPIKLSRTENSTDEFSDFNLDNPRLTLLSNGEYTGVYADNGICYGLYQGNLTINKTKDLLRRQTGAFFAITERDRILPFTNQPIKEHYAVEQSVIFSENSVEYFSNGNDLRAGMKINLHPSIACEIRNFAVKNMSGFRRNLILNAYFEPVLALQRDYDAHPAFMKLFLKIRYDEDNKIFIISRKDRHSSRKLFMAVGFVNQIELSYTLSREKALIRNEGISSFIHLGVRQDTENFSQNVPDPCLLIRAEMPIEPDKQFNAIMFSAFALSEGELLSAVKKIRENAFDIEHYGINSPIARESLEGRLAISMLSNIILGKITSTKIINAIKDNKLNTSSLWSLGISGDFPIVILDADSKENKIKDYIKAQHSLRLCGINFDLIILSSDEAIIKSTEVYIKNEGLEDMLSRAKGIFLFDKNKLDNDKITLIIANSVMYIDSSDKKIEVEEYKPFTLEKIQSTNDNINGINLSYGYFTEHDFAITKKPPNPWCNILSNDVFGTLLSDSSLGFSWALSSRENKLTPWFNDIMTDNDGEMLILKTDSKYIDIINGGRAEFGANRASYKSFSHDILSTTDISIAEKGCIKVIDITLENISETDKEVSMAYYTEPVLDVDREKSYGCVPFLDKNLLLIKNNNNLYFDGMMGILGASQGIGVEKSYVVRKADFWQGKWENSNICPSDNPCASVIIKRILPPKHPIKFRYILSYSSNSDIQSIREEIINAKPISGIKYENQIKISTPDKVLDKIFNNFLPWQSLGGRMWARTGFYQNGGAFGFRDQLQDALSANYFMPSESKKQILRACNAQFEEGDVLHWWHVLPSCKKGVRTKYSDDLLWLPYTISDYIEKTNDNDILDIPVNFIKGEPLGNAHELYQEVFESESRADVYEHGKRAIEKGYKTGIHGLILIGCGDWNDGYNNVGIKGKGESVWLSQFMIMVLEKYLSLASERDDIEFINTFNPKINQLKYAIDKYCWDNDHYIRAFYDNGEKMGSNESEECQIDILPQAFAVLADLPNKERKAQAIKSAASRLIDWENGVIKLFSPPFSGSGRQRPGYVASYPIGLRENGGQYTHAAVWYAMAVLNLGDIEQGYNLIKLLNPAMKYKNNKGEIYKNEPYYISADVYSNPKAIGRGGWSIYTGAASWYYKCILESLLGICIKNNCVKIKPNFPNEWNEYKVSLNIRDTKIKIHASRNFPKGMSENGKIISEIPLDEKEHEIKAN